MRNYANWFNINRSAFKSSRQWRWLCFSLARYEYEDRSVQWALTCQWGKPAKSIMLSFKRFA